MSVDQKHLAEARLGILSILHTIMSSVTLLWSVLHQADNSDKPAAASAASTSNINLGSTKVQQARHIHYTAKSIPLKFRGGGVKVKACFSGVGLEPLIPVKGFLILQHMKAFWTNSCSQLCGKSLGMCPFLSQHDCTPLHKARFLKTWTGKFGVHLACTDS